jgi:hypothetical protein
VAASSRWTAGAGVDAGSSVNRRGGPAGAGAASAGVAVVGDPAVFGSRVLAWIGAATAGGLDPGDVLPDDAPDEDDVARDTVAGSGARSGGDWVSGRDGAATVADRATGATVRTGRAWGAGEAPDAVPDVDGAVEPPVPLATRRETTGSASSSAQSGAPAADAPSSAWRCTGRFVSGACEVRLGTGCGCATTIPVGPLGPASWPSGVTIGGSGTCPGTSARNVDAGATTGGGPDVRWIGGSRRHAPVAGLGAGPGAGTGAAASPADAPEPASPSGPEDAPSADVLRPNGHGRRTGLTPPRSGAG